MNGRWWALALVAALVMSTASPAGAVELWRRAQTRMTRAMAAKLFLGASRPDTVLRVAGPD